MELQRRVNLVIAPAKINAVLIEEMLIQLTARAYNHPPQLLSQTVWLKKPI